MFDFNRSQSGRIQPSIRLLDTIELHIEAATCIRNPKIIKPPSYQKILKKLIMTFLSFWFLEIWLSIRMGIFEPFFLRREEHSTSRNIADNSSLKKVILFNQISVK